MVYTKIIQRCNVMVYGIITVFIEWVRDWSLCRCFSLMQCYLQMPAEAEPTGIAFKFRPGAIYQPQ